MVTYKEFKEIMNDLHHYATAGSPPEGIEAFSEDEQFWYWQAYTLAIDNIRAKSELEYVMPTLPKNKQVVFLQDITEAYTKPCGKSKSPSKGSALVRFRF